MTQLSKPLIVTISGDLGSGKSILTDALCNHWKAERYSTGTVQRQLAADMGISTLELNRLAETDKTIDDKIDGVFASLSQTGKNLIVDSRMAWHFIPDAFKIKLEVNPIVAAERIIADKGRSSENYLDFNATLQGLKDRKASERERFLNYYNADIENHDNYDLVIETTDVTPESICLITNEALDRWIAKQPHDRFWVGAKNLIPTTLADDPELPVTVMRKDGFYVMLQGHNLVADKLKRGHSLIPAKKLDTKSLPPLSSDIINKWQEKHNFKFAVDPQRLIARAA